MVIFMLPAAITLILTVTVVRLMAGLGVDHFAWLTHFTPIAAVAFCSGVYLSRRTALWVALAPFVISDILLNLSWGLAPVGWSFFIRMFTLVALVLVAGSFKAGPRWARALGGTAVGTILFYAGSNTVAWMGPEYVHSFAGWIQSQTTGVPGYPPAYLFLVKSFASEAIFAGLFALAMESTSDHKPLATQAVAVGHNS